MDNKHPSRLANRRSPGGQLKGFTLVELLVVIGIIVVLVSILIPVVGKLRTAANIAATKNVMQQLSGSIEAYYSDFKSYPGPIGETNLIGATNGATAVCTSSQNLIFGLMGGWETATSDPTNQGSGPHFVSANVGKGAMSFLNPGATGNAAYYNQRYRTYSDMINLLPQPWDNPYNVTGAPPDPSSQLYAPEYVDRFPARKTFPAPILYLRAHVGTPAPTSTDFGITTSDDGSPAEYDNAELVAYSSAYPELAGCAAGGKPPVNPATGSRDYATWDAYFQDPSVITGSPPYQYISTPTPTPARRWNTYILISAGPDGIFGTADDIVGPS